MIPLARNSQSWEFQGGRDVAGHLGLMLAWRGNRCTSPSETWDYPFLQAKLPDFGIQKCGVSSEGWGASAPLASKQDQNSSLLTGLEGKQAQTESSPVQGLWESCWCGFSTSQGEYGIAAPPENSECCHRLVPTQWVNCIAWKALKNLSTSAGHLCSIVGDKVMPVFPAGRSGVPN